MAQVNNKNGNLVQMEVTCNLPSEPMERKEKYLQSSFVCCGKFKFDSRVPFASLQVKPKIGFRESAFGCSESIPTRRSRKFSF